ncbi:hypothetical protein KM043_007873 [Ampulex compressa]|nr:hypothetical protein KM043_007873 [Ampulex compressa]
MSIEIPRPKGFNFPNPPPHEHPSSSPNYCFFTAKPDLTAIPGSTCSPRGSPARHRIGALRAPRAKTRSAVQKLRRAFQSDYVSTRLRSTFSMVLVELSTPGIPLTIPPFLSLASLVLTLFALHLAPFFVSNLNLPFTFGPALPQTRGSRKAGLRVVAFSREMSR